MVSFVMAIWTTLRFGLDFLEGSPLRFAFSRLPAIFSVDPILSYAGFRFIVLPMRWLDGRSWREKCVCKAISISLQR
jgi:hypothetical protein